MRFEIVTFGSASQDIFINLKDLADGKKICFELGEKIGVSEVIIKSGGGGTNTAATFSNQGLKTAFFGTIGRDFAGGLVLEDLEKLKIDTLFVAITKKSPTNLSVILSEMKKGRTILVFRGASNLFPRKLGKNLDRTSWFYLAPLGGEMAKATKKIIDFAKNYKIKIAINPSKEQISLCHKKPNLFKRADILILNLEEASFLTKKPIKKEKKIIGKLKKITDGIIVVTKGTKGSLILKDNCLYKTGILPTQVTDRTGAGDAFGSGFLAGLIRFKEIIPAIQLATANAAFCLKKWGAKEGLLKKNQKYPKVKVKKTSYKF
jgi:ribokinase